LQEEEEKKGMKKLEKFKSGRRRKIKCKKSEKEMKEE
jgi:hypothetical protein